MGKQKEKLTRLLKFISFLNNFRLVTRVIDLPGTKNRENDAEHSYQLAMVAWYIIEDQHLKLDLNKVLKLCLIHDLVEAYAGDTFAYAKDKKHTASKDAREAAARKRIKKNFPELKLVSRLLDQYIKHNTPESKFVYALDKVIPMINIYTVGGKTWKTEHVTLEMQRQVKDSKVKLSSRVESYYLDLIEVLTKNYTKYFGRTKPVRQSV